MAPLNDQISPTGRLFRGRAEVTKNLQTAVFAFGLSIICFLIANFFNPALIATYWTQPRRSFDLDFYLSIAERGYLEPSWPAFYPLWPLILNCYSKLLHLPMILPMAHALSLLFFFAATIPLCSLVKNISSAKTASWVILLATLNPNAIFHALAYPESFFCLITVLLLQQMHSFLVSQNKRHLFGIAVLTALASATRPILPQLLAGCIGTAIFFSRRNHNENRNNINKNWLKIFVLMLSAGTAAYIPFGVICHRRFGDFFQPFLAQALWNRKLGLYWDLFLKPQTVGGSDNVLVWELLAFYGPTLAILYYLTRDLSKLENEGHQTTTSHQVIIFCLMVCAAHSAIAFLTYPIFMSLGRHVLSTPFFFVGVTGFVTMALRKPMGNRLLLVLTIVSAAYLINFWTRFARLAWIG